MESFNFALRLTDSVSQPARRATDALRQIEKQAQKTEAAAQKSLSNFGKQFEKVGFAAARDQKRQMDAFAASWAKIGQAAAKAQERAQKASDRAIIARERAVHRRVEQMQDRSLASGLKEGFGVDKIMSGAFWGTMLAEAAFKIVDGMVEGAKKAVEIIVEGIKFAFESAGKRQSLTLGERLSLGAGAKDFQQDVNRFSKLTGFQKSDIEELLLPLRRSGMNQEQTRTAFAAAADVAAGKGKGGDKGEVEKYLKAFESLRLRGGIEVEQLAGLGIDVHGFYGDVGKKLGGLSEKATKERMQEGKVDRNLLLNTVYERIQREQGGRLGTGAIAYSKTFEARWEKLKSLPEQFFMNIANTAGFKRASDALGSLLEALDPDGPQGQRIIKSLESMFDKIAGFIGDPDDAAASFADHLEAAVQWTKDLIDSVTDLVGPFGEVLDTVQDTVFALREMKAYAKIATTAGFGEGMADLAEVKRDKAAADQKRIDRAADKYVRQATPELFANNVTTNMLDEQFNQTLAGYGGPLGLNPLGLGAALMNAGHDTQIDQSNLRDARGSKKTVGVTIPKIELQFYGPVDEKTAQEVAPQIHREATTAMEAAATGAF